MGFTMDASGCIQYGYKQRKIKTTVVSIVEENILFRKVRVNVPDPEMQPPTIPVTPTQDLKSKPPPVLPAP